MSAAPLLEAAGVSRRFGARRAVERVSLRVDAGEVVGLVGPNGAGKTTLLRLLAGYLDPDEGTVTIAGHDLAGARTAAQARLGYLPESAPLPPELRVREHLRLRAALKGVRRGDRDAAVATALARADVADVADRVIATLSKGYRQRVALADALVADPPVLLLDEPASGLDPLQARQLRGLLAELAGRRAVLLSTHALGELESLAARVVVVAGGRVVADAPAAALRGDAPTLEEAVVARLQAAAREAAAR